MNSPANHRRERVAEDDPGAVRRREQEPPREAGLEVARDAEPGEDAAECGRLDEHEAELRTRCSRARSRSPGPRRPARGPPANAVKKKSGNTSDGNRIDGFVKTLFSVRQATPDATGQMPHVRVSLDGERGRRQQPARRTVITKREPEAERERLRVPARDDQAPHRLDQVRDRVDRRERLEPLDLHQVARGVHRGDEQEDEEQREQALDRLAGAGAQREVDPDRAEPDGRRARRRGAGRRSRPRPDANSTPSEEADERCRRSPGRARARRSRRAAPRSARSRASASARAG